MSARFVGDFHIHSHYSIATSGQLVPEHLDLWARTKGIAVVGTGDFTHPGWLAELGEKLDPAEPGLFRLKPALSLPGAPAPAPPVRFLLTAEISTIYSRDGAHAQGAPRAVRSRLRRRRARAGRARPHRQHHLRRPPHPRHRLARPARDRPRGLARDPLCARPHLDALVLGPRLEVGLRLDRGVLPRSRGPHLRGRDRALVGPAHELGLQLPRPLHPDLELRRPLAGKARPRGESPRLRPLLRRHRRHTPHRRSRALSRHHRVLSRRRQVPLQRPPQVRRLPRPRRDPALQAASARSAASRSSSAWPAAWPSSPTATT